MKAESSLITSHQIMWLSMWTHFPQFPPLFSISSPIGKFSPSCLLLMLRLTHRKPSLASYLSIKKIIFPSTLVHFYRKIILAFICMETHSIRLIFRLASNFSSCCVKRERDGGANMRRELTSNFVIMDNKASSTKVETSWHVAIAISSLFI